MQPLELPNIIKDYDNCNVEHFDSLLIHWSPKNRAPLRTNTSYQCML